jgi:hypothetical protein
LTSPWLGKLDDEFAITHFHGGGFADARPDLLREYLRHPQGEAVTPLQELDLHDPVPARIYNVDIDPLPACQRFSSEWKWHRQK